MTGQLICQACAAAYPLDEARWRCDCGALLDVAFDPAFEPVFDRERIARRKPTMWRYREAIPIRDDAHVVSFDEGFTPLIPVEVDGREVLVKQDHLFPTGSYKDRGASVLVSKVKELGIRHVVEDSSGNAGSAIAAYCARAGVRCDIFVPASTTAGKLAQIQGYGATLHQIPGSREDTARAALEAAQQTYYASHVWNPIFFQGTKTFAFEVCEQLGWHTPDTVILPVGNGTLLLGAHLGFEELLAAGVVSRRPKIIAVQAANCAPLYRAFQQGQEAPTPIDAQATWAEGIAIAEPVRGPQILRAVGGSGGHFLAVSANEIKQALKDICRWGFYIEPSAAASIAGVRQYVRRAPADETIVTVFTGHGLKTTEKMLKLL
ncbi:MAG TPA: threonine synthase [Chloroflexi bacterium]|nr:threonine synthase [Chloroflexota bacterium]